MNNGPRRFRHASAALLAAALTAAGSASAESASESPDTVVAPATDGATLLRAECREPMPPFLPARGLDGSYNVPLLLDRYVVKREVVARLPGAHVLDWATPALGPKGQALVDVPPPVTAAAQTLSESISETATPESAASPTRQALLATVEARQRCACERALSEAAGQVWYLVRPPEPRPHALILVTGRLILKLKRKAEIRDVRGAVDAVGRARVTAIGFVENGWFIDLEREDYGTLPEIMEQLLELKEVEVLEPELVWPLEPDRAPPPLRGAK